MNEHLRTAALGGAIGAVLVLVLLGVGVATGVVPLASNARLHDYLMAHPDLAYEMQAKADSQQADAEQRQQQAAVDKLGLKKFFDPKLAYVTGPANAKNTFVEFFDYNCGHCRNTFPNVRKFYEAHKNDTRFAFIDLPIFGEASTNAARASIAARRQGADYLAFHFALMGEGKTAIDTDILRADAAKAGLDIKKLSADILEPETDKSIVAALRLARQADFGGTPYFIINGKVHEGEITEAELKQMTKG